MMAGYCTPRHALVVAWILTLAGGAGLAHVASILARMVARLMAGRWAATRVEAALTAASTRDPGRGVSPGLDGPDRLGLCRLS